MWRGCVALGLRLSAKNLSIGSERISPQSSRFFSSDCLLINFQCLMFLFTYRASISIGDLAFEAPEVAAREVFFFNGAIFVWRGFFVAGDGFEIGGTLSVDSELSTKALKCRGWEAIIVHHCGSCI